MSNKPWEQLNPLDQALRRALPPHVGTPGPTPVVQVIIEKIHGFELFNTRPFHNYENWADGWRIKSPDGRVTVSAEDLDDAVKLYIERIREV